MLPDHNDIDNFKESVFKLYNSMQRYCKNSFKLVKWPVYVVRLRQCFKCEHYNETIYKKCDICKCSLFLKCALPTEECPLKKWTTVSDVDIKSKKCCGE